MVHCERANGELLDASFQNSKTPDGHCTAIAPIAAAPRANAPTANARMAVLPFLIASVTLFVCVIGPFSFPHRLMPGLPLTQNWIGKSFVHAICGPYLQGCGNQL
jgi:hypothetical protein